MEPPDRNTYRCKYCGVENYSKKSSTGIAKTRIGDYGDNGTPEPQLFVEEFLVSTVIAFKDTPSIYVGKVSAAIVLDSSSIFKDAHFKDAMLIRIESTSGLNDGDYKIASRGVSDDEILIDDSYSLTTETFAAAGEVTISRLLYKPNIKTGCFFCGTLNSK